MEASATTAMPPPNLTGVLIGGRNDDNKPVGKSFLYS
jgi:hypothetical protein